MGSLCLMLLVGVAAARRCGYGCAVNQRTVFVAAGVGIVVVVGVDAVVAVVGIGIVCCPWLVAGIWPLLPHCLCKSVFYVVVVVAAVIRLLLL